MARSPNASEAREMEKPRQNRFAIGIDLGGTNLKIGLVDSAGRVVGLRSVPVTERNPQEISRVIEREILHTMRLHAQTRQIEGIGIAVPSAVAKNRVLNAPAYPGLNTVDLAAILKKRLKMRVRLANDASAGLHGELAFGVGRKLSPEQKENAMIVTMGTNVGGRVMVRGKEYVPPNPKWKEIFWGEPHVPVIASKQTQEIVRWQARRRDEAGQGMGAVHQFARTQAISDMARRYIETNPKSLLSRLSKKSEVTPQLVDQAARGGDRGARSLLRTAGAAVGFAAANRAEELGSSAVLTNHGIFRSPYVRQAFVQALRQKGGWAYQRRAKFLEIATRARQELGVKPGAVLTGEKAQALKEKIRQLGGDEFRLFHSKGSPLAMKTPVPVHTTQLEEPGVFGAAALILGQATRKAQGRP